MLFPKADVDSVVQLADMFRIDASKAFYTQGEVLTEINIYPDFANTPGTFFNVYVEDCPDDWFLDWAYEVVADYTVRVEMKTAVDTKTVDYTVGAIDEATDNLQSDDSMIYALESDLKQYVPDGRNSWKYMSRAALQEMIDYMYRYGLTNPDGTKIEKSQLIGDKLEQWSLYETMTMIYQELKATNSVFYNEKITDYTEKRNSAREIYCFEYDSNKDGNVDEDDVQAHTTVDHFTR